MARVTRNSLLQGLSGKLGGLVFRQVGHQTVVSAAQATGPRPASPKQQAQRQRMYQAQQYAKAQLLDPAAKALYATGIDARLTSAYTVAVADYMQGPVITAVDLDACQGQPGNPIGIYATDNFAVTAVHVRLLDAQGQLTTEGAATARPDGSWGFVCPLAVPPGATLEVQAFDRPGNQAVRSFPL